MEAGGAGEGRSREQALAAALGALRRRERTIDELRGWLAARDQPAELIEAVIAELIEIGELDDERFAHRFAADKRELSGWGPERIEAALLDRGLGRPLAERAAREEHDAQLERASAQVRRRFGVPADDAERARALAYLGRRGFGYELAYDAIRRAGRDAA